MPRSPCFGILSFLQILSSQRIPLSSEFLPKRDKALLKSRFQNLLVKILPRNVLVRFAIFSDIIHNASLHATVVDRLLRGFVPYKPNGVVRPEDSSFYVSVR